MKKLFIGLAALLLAGGLAADRLMPRATRHTPESLTAVASDVGLHFPASTRLLGVVRENGLDDWIGVKVEMAESELDGFLRSTPVDPARMNEGDQARLGVDHDF